MGKAFLSHSSKDKIMVRKVAKKLGRQCIYDDFTFEAGMKNLDEILKGLEKSELFVIFLSENSLNSDWVKKELKQAEKNFTEKELKKIYPIIIDKNIKYTDERIPDWMKEYNLRPVLRHGKVIAVIERLLREIKWSKYSLLKEKENLFIGRNKLIEKFEEKIEDYDNSITCFIASGVDRIGRKSFLTHSLKKVHELKKSHKPSEIIFSSKESIESFIKKIYDLGFNEERRLENLIDIEVEEKISIAVELIKEIQELEEIVFIIDKGGIVKSSGEIVPWFYEIIKKINKKKFIFGIASKFKAKRIYKYDYIEEESILELSINERKNLFLRLLKIEKMKESFSKEDLKWITNLFMGYPEQILHAFEILKKEGIDGIKNKSHEIVEYNTQRVLEVLKEYSESEKEILYLLSEFEYISSKYLCEIIGDSYEQSEIIEKFINNGICEKIGALKEYLRLSDNIRDYFGRASFKMKEEYEEKLKEVTTNFLNNLNDIQEDYSAISYSLKTALKNKEIDNELKKFLIPSHFLETMVELYQKDKKYQEVISLADKILSKKDFLDKTIAKEIRYFLCLALARTRDSRFMEEVKEINGFEHNFLFGFYYRMKGDSKNALERYERVLEKNRSHPRAKRELVRIYTDLGYYDSAFELSKELYEINKTNPHNVQAYLKCLIRNKPHKKEEIDKVLDNFKKIKTEMGEEMYKRATAEYLAYIKNDKKALEIIAEVVGVNKDNHYPLVEEFFIAEKFNKLQKMEGNWEKIKEMQRKKSYLSNICKELELTVLAKKGDRVSVNLKLKTLGERYPVNFKEKLEKRLERLLELSEAN